MRLSASWHLCWLPLVLFLSAWVRPVSTVEAQPSAKDIPPDSVYVRSSDGDHLIRLDGHIWEWWQEGGWRDTGKRLPFPVSDLRTYAFGTTSGWLVTDRRGRI